MKHLRKAERLILEGKNKKGKVRNMGLKINKDKLRERQARLRGEGKSSNRGSVFWFPKAGTYNVRLLPWAEEEHSEDPFKELWFYYNLAGTVEYNGKTQRGKAPLALRQFNEDDPVADRITILRNKVNEGFLAEMRGVEEGTEKTDDDMKDDLEFAKNLYANKTFYLACIVRGKEDEGPKIWQNSSRKVYERLVDLFLKDRVGDKILDISENGRDLEIKISFNEAMQGNTGKTVNIDPDFDDKPLSEDEDKVEAWLKVVPDPYKLMEKRKLSYDDLETRYIDWHEEYKAKEAEKEAENSDGQEHGSTDTEAETAKDEVEEPKKAPKKKGRSKASMKDALNGLKE